jgi:hypothetical protein
MIEDNSIKESHISTIPYPLKGNWKDKSLFILSAIEKGSAADVAGKIAEYEETDNVAALEEHIEEALSSLMAEDLVKGELSEQVMIYSAVYPLQNQLKSVPCGVQKSQRDQVSE